MRPRRIEVHIAEVVLSGEAAEGRRAVTAGLRRELARRLAAGGLPPAVGEAVGAQVAAAVHPRRGGTGQGGAGQ